MNVRQQIRSAITRLMFGKFAFDVLPTWQVGRPAYTNTSFANNITSGYRKNELIYACISIKSNSAAVPVLRVHRKSDGEKLPDHPLRALIANPNPMMTEFDFHAANLSYLDLAGRAYWEKERSRAGKLIHLWPLRPDWLKPIRQTAAAISGYLYDVPGERGPTLLATDVLAMRLWDPLDQYNGLAPVQVAARIGDVDNATTDFIKLFWEHGGMPMGLLSSKQMLTDPQVTSIRARWRERYGGYKNWTEPAVLDSEATYQRTGLTFGEMGFDALDARSEARICMVLRVPPILVGAKVGLDRSTFANYAEARKSFWQDTLLPQYRHIEDALNADLVPEFGGDIELRWDFSMVPALQEDENAKWTRANEALSRGGITVTEYRDILGLAHVANGDVFIRSLVQQEVPVRMAVGGKGQLHDVKVAANALDDNERRKRERELERAMTEYLGGQLDRIVAEVRGDGHD